MEASDVVLLAEPCRGGVFCLRVCSGVGFLTDTVVALFVAFAAEGREVVVAERAVFVAEGCVRVRLLVVDEGLCTYVWLVGLGLAGALVSPPMPGLKWTVAPEPENAMVAGPQSRVSEPPVTN